MAKLFDISVPTASTNLKVNAKQKTEITYTVSNLSGRSVRGRMVLKPDDPPVKNKWVTVAEESEKDFGESSTFQFKVAINMPANATPGKYTFRLDAVNANIPDEGDSGPAIGLEVVGAQAGSPPKWIFPVVAVVLLLVVGTVAWLLLKPAGVTDTKAHDDPAVVTKTKVHGDPAVDVEKLVGRWLDAFLKGRTDDVVASASEPFYLGKKVLLTKADLRKEYEAERQIKGASWLTMEIQGMTVKTVREFQGTQYDLSKDRTFNDINLSLDDSAAVVRTKLGAMIIPVRRAGDGYEILGLWD